MNVDPWKDRWFSFKSLAKSELLKGYWRKKENASGKFIKDFSFFQIKIFRVNKKCRNCFIRGGKCGKIREKQWTEF